MVKIMHVPSILILDFGSQYTRLIARRLRDMGVATVIHPNTIDSSEIERLAPAGIILSGGPETVTQSHTPRAPAAVFSSGCPVLGICYGMQVMVLQLGGEVAGTDTAEFGYAALSLLQESVLFEGMGSSERPGSLATSLNVWMSHGDIVTRLPSGFEKIAVTEHSPYAVIADHQRQFFGCQFHPEVTHTVQGHLILENFVKQMCGVVPVAHSVCTIEDRIQAIRAQVGDKGRVLLGLSGGVDSSVAALLIHRAIGERLVCVMVDTGLLRLHEAGNAVDMFAELGISVRCEHAEDDFITALHGRVDPEAKRKVIGAEFIRVFERVAQQLDIEWLAQGTIYPDVIESASQGSQGQVIKTHHNVGGLPANMGLKLLEPLRELFKDEVRELGLALQLPRKFLYCHPFPGPGLAVRILGEVKSEYIAILQRADAIFMAALHEHKLYDQVSQAFAVFIPSQSVGVKGDARHYGYIIALRAVKTVDFMTAEWAALPHQFLSALSHRIVNEIKEVSRVVYDISNKPPATIEWE